LSLLSTNKKEARMGTFGAILIKLAVRRRSVEKEPLMLCKEEWPPMHHNPSMISMVDSARFFQPKINPGFQDTALRVSNNKVKVIVYEIVMPACPVRGDRHSIPAST
jgi:hypothetical protein